MTAAPAPSPPADVPAPLPPATGGPALLAADAAPPLQERAIPGASSPLVTGALVDLQEAPARADNPFGFGAGLRHYFGRDETSALPYIGLDAGVQERNEPPALTGHPFGTPVWQPQIGLRAGVTYPVSSGFALGIASGIYYQSEALSPDPAAEQGGRLGHFLARFATFFCLGLFFAGFLVCLRAFWDLAMRLMIGLVRISGARAATPRDSPSGS